MKTQVVIFVATPHRQHHLVSTLPVQKLRRQSARARRAVTRCRMSRYFDHDNNIRLIAIATSLPMLFLERLIGGGSRL